MGVVTIDLANPTALIRLVWSWITWAAGLAITVMVLAYVAQRYGLHIPHVPTAEPMQLAALAVAYWAMPKG